jgi:aryl-alcohol dehydrogenase-like predicted oxidoreductase
VTTRHRRDEPRRLGASGPPVTPLGLGLAALGRPAYINLGHGEDLGGARSVADLEARAHAVLDEAWRAGVRYFDAARSYGRAERFLASWLAARGIAPADVAIGSKWGYTYTADWRVDASVHEVKDHSLATLTRQWRETRERLGPHLDLYQVHSVTLESEVLDDARLHVALLRLRQDGVLIGLSTSGPHQAEVISRATRLRVAGARLFDSVQATWNVLERSAEPALAAAHAAGMGVIVKEALANGRLTERNDDPAFAERRALLVAQSERLATTVDALGLAAALARPWADVVLSGATTTAQLRSNLAALHVAWDARASDVLAALTEPPAAYWQRRAALPWT